MKVTISAIKADVGAIGGHTKPSEALVKAVKHTVNDASKSG
ncbi:MAG: fructose 1,6-bisphosphatase, partial [Nitrosopumilaceae archaeon]